MSIKSATREERLAAEAKLLREQAAKLPPGIERESLLRNAQQDEAASHVSEWFKVLRPPE